MNHLRDVLTAQFIDWLGAESYTTQRGRIKQRLVGKPSKTFWQRYKRHKLELRRTGVSVERTGAREWAVVVWINPVTRPEIEAAGLAEKPGDPF